jgi:hypothetical protein
MAQRQRSRAQWRQLVEGWPRSGLTQRGYCERHGISLASLRRWREIFRAERGAAGAESGERPRLVPVNLVAEGPWPTPGTGLTLVLGDGVRLEIAPGFDEPTLRRVLGVLRAAA